MYMYILYHWTRGDICSWLQISSNTHFSSHTDINAYNDRINPINGHIIEGSQAYCTMFSTYRENKDANFTLRGDEEKIRRIECIYV